MYKIIYKPVVSKFLNKLKNNVKLRVLKEIKKLETSPFPRKRQHYIKSDGKKLLCELSMGKLPIRFYYYIFKDTILFENVEFNAKDILVYDYTNTKAGDKKGTSQQQRKINSIKKMFLLF
jgi:mRNA-degrading endonuclease RelE of RelBE toxin-antitoxin system